MVEKVLYSTRATASGGGRDGRTALDDGSFDAQLSVPKELGGPGGEGLNPEKLFAMGYAACFLGALRHVAAGRKVKLPDETRVSVETGIGPRAEGGFGLEVAITADLPGVARDLAEDLVASAHDVCPYSHATGGRLQITPQLA